MRSAMLLLLPIVCSGPSPADFSGVVRDGMWVEVRRSTNHGDMTMDGFKHYYGYTVGGDGKTSWLREWENSQIVTGAHPANHDGNKNSLSLTEQKASNIEMAAAPAYTSVNTTFNLMLAMNHADKANCYTENGDGVWDRTVFRGAVRDALNAIAIQQVALDAAARNREAPLINQDWTSSTPYMMTMAEMHTNIKLERVVESTKPFLSMETSGCDFNEDCYFLGRHEDDTIAPQDDLRNFWNVYLRVTIVDIPEEIAYNFRPFLGAFTGYNPYHPVDGAMGMPSGTTAVSTTTGTYTKFCPHTKYLFNSFWISTEDNFLGNRLAPVTGRGRNNTLLLIPLIMGILFMLGGPILVIALVVFHQEQVNEFDTAMKAKEFEIEKKRREESILEEQMASFKKSEEKLAHEKAEKDKKKKEDHEYEIDQTDINWGSGQPPAK